MNDTEANKYEERRRSHYWMQLTNTNLCLYAIVYIAMHLFWPAYNTPILGFIPGFFWFFGLIQFYIMKRNEKRGVSRGRIYLALKTLKLISAIILLLIYKLAGGTEIIVFSILVIIYYWANLILETTSIVRYEQKYKK